MKMCQIATIVVVNIYRFSLRFWTIFIIIIIIIIIITIVIIIIVVISLHCQNNSYQLDSMLVIGD